MTAIKYDLPLIPLRDVVVFPGVVSTLFVGPNIDLEKVIVDENSVIHSTDPIKVYKSSKKKSSSAG